MQIGIDRTCHTAFAVFKRFAFGAFRTRLHLLAARIIALASLSRLQLVISLVALKFETRIRHDRRHGGCVYDVNLWGVERAVAPAQCPSCACTRRRSVKSYRTVSKRRCFVRSEAREFAVSRTQFLPSHRSRAPAHPRKRGFVRAC